MGSGLFSFPDYTIWTNNAGLCVRCKHLKNVTRSVGVCVRGVRTFKKCDQEVWVCVRVVQTLINVVNQVEQRQRDDYFASLSSR